MIRNRLPAWRIIDSGPNLGQDMPEKGSQDNIISGALEMNEKAIRFYERHGFIATGEKKPEEGTTEYLVLLKKEKE